MNVDKFAVFNFARWWQSALLSRATVQAEPQPREKWPQTAVAAPTRRADIHGRRPLGPHVRARLKRDSQ
jgi:hypothetical protein